MEKKQYETVLNRLLQDHFGKKGIDAFFGTNERIARARAAGDRPFELVNWIAEKHQLERIDQDGWTGPNTVLNLRDERSAIKKDCHFGMGEEIVCCPLCGRRTDFDTDLEDLEPQDQYHRCLNPNCEFEFITSPDDESDESDESDDGVVDE